MSDPKRINVAISPEALAAVMAVIETEQVSLTEAVRRLIGYGEVMWRAAKFDNQALLLASPDGDTREVVIL